MTFLVSMNVLRNETGAPIPEGRFVVEGLATVGRVVLSTDLEFPIDRARAWLARRGIRLPMDIRDEIVPDMLTFIRHLEIEMAFGHVDLAVTSDPDEARMVFERGVTPLLFTSRRLVSPSKRPDGPRPWEEVVRYAQ